MKNLILFLFILIVSIPVAAQKKGNAQAMDSVKVRGRSFLILGDSSIYVAKDTVFFLPDSIAVKMTIDETRRSDEFYDKVKERFYRTKFTKELYKILFSDSKPAGKSVPKANVGHTDFVRQSGKVINRIIIKKLEVFGTSINDTTKNVDSRYINIANGFHVYTRRHIIKNNIFFKEGDVIDPDNLEDSERVLRSLPYIRDARIYVVPKDGNMVDVIVVVKDVWSITGDVNFSSVEKFDLAIIERNFLGFGHEFRNELLYNTQYSPVIGYSGTYSMNNIKSTFITGELSYAHSEPFDHLGIRFYRNFITPEIKYAGGAEVSRSNILINRVYEDTTISFYTDFSRKDFWLARSWLIRKDRDEGRTNLQTAARYERVNYYDRPLVTSDTNQLFFDRHLYLYSIGLSRRNYEKSSLVLGYGRTEDIPLGYLLEFTTGKEVNEFYSRPYVGWRMSIGQYVDRMGYFRPSLAFGGFLKNGEVEQGAFNIELDYFSFLYRIKKLNFRQFFKIGYTIGFHRFNDEFININNFNGVRGLSDTFLRGTKKINFRSETVAFTPFYVVGFRFAFFGFVDLAVVNADASKLLKNQLYQGYGVGLRIRNENLAFNAIQLRLAWYPVVPPDNSAFGLDISGQAPLRIPDFRIEEPDVVGFN